MPIQTCPRERPIRRDKRRTKATATPKPSDDRVVEVVRSCAHILRSVSRTTYLPFILVFFLLVSRHPLFDALPVSITHAGVYALAVFVMMIIIVLAQRTVETVIDEAEDVIRRRNLERKVSQEEREDKHLHNRDDELKTLRSESVVNLFRNPLLRGALIPMG